jgi:hypothetical protein
MITSDSDLVSLPAFPGVKFSRIARYSEYVFGDDGTAWSRKPRNGRGPLKTTWSKLSGTVFKSGYVYVSIRSRPKRLARLLLEAFVGPCPEGMQACHSDGDKANNAISNLRWDTPEANMADRELHGTSAKGVRNPAAKLDDVKVRSIRVLLSEGYSQSCIAAQFGITQVLVSRISLRKTWGWLE